MKTLNPNVRRGDLGKKKNNLNLYEKRMKTKYTTQQNYNNKIFKQNTTIKRVIIHKSYSLTFFLLVRGSTPSTYHLSMSLPLRRQHCRTSSSYFHSKNSSPRQPLVLVPGMGIQYCTQQCVYLGPEGSHSLHRAVVVGAYSPLSSQLLLFLEPQWYLPGSVRKQPLRKSATDRTKGCLPPTRQVASFWPKEPHLKHYNLLPNTVIRTGLPRMVALYGVS